MPVLLSSLLCQEPRSSIGVSTSSFFTLHFWLRGVAVRSPTGHDCVICQDPIYGVEVRAPCGHYYDIGCVTDLFQSATRDETLYPPRCCRQNIPFTQVQPHLSQTLLVTFQQKQAEFSTLKRVYCSSPTCSRFLGPLSEGVFASKVYTCPAPGCGRRTCGKCREQYNGDWTHVCRPDADADQVLALGRAAGWARCPGCSQMIELHLGCFHMTCRCRTEFCYLCRARWKTCRCPQWDEGRLLLAAEERVDAQLGVGRERGARRDVPAQPARPAPPPVPVRHPRVQVGNAQANRAPVVIPGARPPVPVPTPAQRLAAATAVLPAPAPPPTVQLPRPQATPARTPTVGASTSSNSARLMPRFAPPTNTASTSTVPTRTHTNTVTFASTSTSASASSSGQALRPKSVSNIDAMRQRMVREMMDRLRVDHDCDHKGWRYRSGGGRCQSCGHHLPLYLFVSGSASSRVT
ncbi:hypothetical protein J3R83DRAFT_10699 [Lanmaoa asiatica]|nr:hypothetical protein J3R83DRAFT_10699 [Lanmaoa asiatica]